MVLGRGMGLVTSKKVVGRVTPEGGSEMSCDRKRDVVSRKFAAEDGKWRMRKRQERKRTNDDAIYSRLKSW